MWVLRVVEFVLYAVAKQCFTVDFDYEKFTPSLTTDFAATPSQIARIWRVKGWFGEGLELFRGSSIYFGVLFSYVETPLPWRGMISEL